MEYVITPPSIPTLLVEGTQARFPVHRIYCVGRNYAEHAREMGHDPTREPPFFFLKPADAIVTDGADFPYPPGGYRWPGPVLAAAGSGARPRTREQWPKGEKGCSER